jgi:two-component sensor histidine kinase/putative methionine-R-sulfoxide reductase with GAF domain
MEHCGCIVVNAREASRAMTIDGQTAERTMLRLREYLRTLEGLSRIGADKLPPERLMHHVAAQVSRVTRIERSKVMRYRRDRGDLLVEAGVGWKPGVVGHATLAVDHRSPAGRAFQTATPVAIHNIYDSSDFRVPELLREHGIVSLLNVPVMINGHTWGVLEVDSAEPAIFDEWDVSFLGTLANIMGACLALHEAERQGIEAAAQRAREQAQADVAVRELQHRIKNNLQIIIAFLSVKIRDGSAEVKEKLNSVIGRVQAIALAHDLLSIGGERSSVEFADYLRSLCANIDPQRPEIVIEVHAQPAQIPIDRAVPAGLVVNELVTNSLKYAFGNGGGRITIHFAPVNNASQACVAVEDNGRGMTLPPRKGVGLNLVEAFAHQIQGRIEFMKVDSGTKTELCFPVAL